MYAINYNMRLSRMMKIYLDTSPLCKLSVFIAFNSLISKKKEDEKKERAPFQSFFYCTYHSKRFILGNTKLV